jgi:hypothetical protein
MRRRLTTPAEEMSMRLTAMGSMAIAMLAVAGCDRSARESEVASAAASSVAPAPD